MKRKLLQKIIPVCLCLSMALTVFSQTTVVFTDRGANLIHTIDAIDFTFGATTSGSEPAWNASSEGYQLNANGENWIEFTLSDIATIKAYEPVATSARISLKYSTDGGTNFTQINNVEGANGIINKTGSIIFRFQSTNNSTPIITKFDYVNITVATKLDLKLQDGNLYETSRPLRFRIEALGDNGMSGTNADGTQLSVTYSVSGAAEVVPATSVALVNSAFTIPDIKVTAAGDYTLTVTDNASGLAPLNYNFTVVEKRAPLAEWDFINMANVSSAVSTVTFAPTDFSYRNSTANKFYGADGAYLKPSTGFLRLDTVTTDVVDKDNFKFTAYGLQTVRINASGATGLKVFVSLDGNSAASPDKVEVFYSLDSTSFESAGTVTVGAVNNAFGTNLDLPVLAEDEERLFLKFSTAADAGLLDTTAIVAGSVPHLRYWRIYLTATEITPPVKVSDINLTAEGGSAVIDSDGGSLQINAEVLPEDAFDKKYSWTINAGATGAVVSSTGLVTASGESSGNGTVKVFATAHDGSGVSDSLEVVISGQETPPSLVTKITLSTDSAAEITVDGGSLQINLAVMPANAADTTVTWTIDAGTTGAIVSNTGLVTASGLDEGNGTVKVYAAANDISGVSDSIILTITNQTTIDVGIANMSAGICKVYPNPASDIVTVEMTARGNIQIMDITGRTVKSLQQLSGTVSIPVHDYSQGIYLIKVSAEGQSQTIRLVIR